MDGFVCKNYSCTKIFLFLTVNSAPGRDLN